MLEFYEKVEKKMVKKRKNYIELRFFVPLLNICEYVGNGTDEWVDFLGWKLIGNLFNVIYYRMIAQLIVYAELLTIHLAFIHYVHINYLLLTEMADIIYWTKTA